VDDGDHDLGPRGASGYTRKGNLTAAADANCCQSAARPPRRPARDCYDVGMRSTQHDCEDFAKSRRLPRRRLLPHVRIRRLRSYGADLD